MEVDLAEIVISYIDHLERRGELDLEAATEFLVLIAALLELKSRLLLPGEEQEIIEIDPGEAAEELLARLLDAHRYRSAAEHLRSLIEGQAGYRFRKAALPASLRRAALPQADAVYDPAVLGRAVGTLLTLPEPVDVGHMSSPKVTVAERLVHLRALLRRGRVSFDEAVARADRVTVAVTLFAVLELYKQGELTWTQEEPFGEITLESAGGAAAGSPGPSVRRSGGGERRVRGVRRVRRSGGGERRVRWVGQVRRPGGGVTGPELERVLEALLFCPANRWASRRWPRPANLSYMRWPRRSSACASTTSSSAAASCCASWRGDGCCPRTPTPSRRPGGCSLGRARRPSPPPRPRRWPSSPTCSPSPGPRSPAFAGSTPSRRRPRCSSAVWSRSPGAPSSARCSTAPPTCSCACSGSPPWTSCPRSPPSTPHPTWRRSCASGCCGPGRRGRGWRRGGKAPRPAPLPLAAAHPARPPRAPPPRRRARQRAPARTPGPLRPR